MKILFYCDTVFSFGGVQRVLAEVAKALCADHQVVILTTDRRTDLTMYGYSESSVQFDYISYDGCPTMEHLLCKAYSFLYKNVLPHTKYTSELYSKSFFPPAYKSRLMQKINQGNYDVVIGVHAYLSLHLASISDKIHAKKIGWMHNSYEAFFEKENPYLQGLDCFFRWQMKKLDKVIVLSHADVACFSRKMSLRAEVVYNPLTVLSAGKGGRHHKKFLAIGRFSFKHKGFDILIKAFSIFVKTHPKWKLEIIGEGPEEQFYRSLIKEYNLESSVQLYPFTKDVQSHYVCASIYVLSSRWEGFGLVLIEAMAHGLPIISSDLPVTRELLKDRGVAIFFEKENIQQLAECMEYMVKQINLELMGEKAYEYARKFNIDNVCMNWNKLLKETVDGTR